MNRMKCGFVLIAAVTFGAEGQGIPTPLAGAESAHGVQRTRSFWSGWSGSVEIGLNGSDGNSSAVNLRLGAHAERKTEFAITRANLSFAYSRKGSVTTRHRLEANIRNDWKFESAPRWRYYVAGEFEYDQFQE